MNVLIIDDDENFIDDFKQRITLYAQNSCVEIQIAGFCLKDNQMPDFMNYDLLFIDIEMPVINGIELGKLIVEKRGSNELPLLVFVTNKDNYVFTALKVSPFYFIRKNSLDDELDFCLKKAVNKIKGYKENVCSIKVDKKNLLIAVRDIIYVMKQGNMVVYKTINGEYCTRKTISSVIDELGPTGFIRTHEGFAVNVDYIKEMCNKSVVLINDEELVLSRKYKHSATEGYMEWISRRMRI